MSYGLSTKAVGAPVGVGLRSRLAQPVKYIPLSHFFTQTGDEMEKYGIVGYADREEWGMLDPKEAKRGSNPVKAERETTKDPQKMKGVKKRAQKSPEDEEEPEESQGGEEDSKAAEGKPDAKTDEKEAAADSEAEPETGPEDDSGGTADSGDEDADEKKSAKKKAKSGEEDDEEIDTEKNNPYLKHPFPPKEKSQEGANAPGNLLAEASLPRKGSRYGFFITGDSQGNWELDTDYDFGALKSGKWTATASLSRKNEWRHLSVDNATEHSSGFLKALKEIVKKYPEIMDWVVSFDGPDIPVSQLVGQQKQSDLSRLVFYHGTSLWAWEKIKREGLRPRSETNVEPVYGAVVGASQGRKEAIYLTTQLHMARAAARDASNVAFRQGYPKGMVILKVTGLDPRKMLPDEDSRESTALGSLEKMGSIAYLGAISPGKIKLQNLEESGGPLLPVKAGATRALTGATSTGNIATAPVPIGAGDGRKFLDRPGKRKKKPRRLSGQLYILLRP